MRPVHQSFEGAGGLQRVSSGAEHDVEPGAHVIESGDSPRNRRQGGGVRQRASPKGVQELGDTEQPE